MFDISTKYNLWGNVINWVSGVLFLIGSILFFFSRKNIKAFYTGVAFFTIGSLLFVIGPIFIIKTILINANDETIF